VKPIYRRLRREDLLHTAIRQATAAGLRLVSASHFFTSDTFGALDRYVPSGPVLF
jgi:hypothetical protein